MPAKTELTMRQLRQMLRLHYEGVSARELGRQLGVARSTVQDNLDRARKAGVAWPLAADHTDDVLEQRLFSKAGYIPGVRRRPEPDWAKRAMAHDKRSLAGWQAEGALVRDLKRPGVNLSVLWEEYCAANPDGYGYSRFCDLFREFELRLSPVMRQHHVAGDKLFVDYSGKKIGITDPVTGVVRQAEIFVGVLGASNYTYAEATFTQSLPDWIGAHVRIFGFLGGVPRLLVPPPATPPGCAERSLLQAPPDHLKSGVQKASFYDPEINRSYGAMAPSPGHPPSYAWRTLASSARYEVGILPARPKKPRDKAAVEAGVRFAQTYILGRLRHQTFFSLAKCNAAIREVMERMNRKVMRRIGMSRQDLFESLDRLALKPLPETGWHYAEWRLARVGVDYHVEVEGFYYSVPHALIRAEVDLPITERTSTAASAWRLTSAATAGAGMVPSPTICRAPTAVTPSGRPSVSNAGARPSDRTRKA